MTMYLIIAAFLIPTVVIGILNIIRPAIVFKAKKINDSAPAVVTKRKLSESKITKISNSFWEERKKISMNNNEAELKDALKKGKLNLLEFNAKNPI